MIQYLYDNNIIVYTFAVLCGLGLILRIIVNSVYKHLVNESDHLGETKNKVLRHMKLKFSTCYKLKIGVNNVDTFVDKSVSNYRFGGLLLSTWDNGCGQILYLILLIVPVSSVFGVASGCGQDQVLFTGAVGILASSILIIVDKSINLMGKKRLLRLNLLDYLENFCKVRLEQELTNPELVEQYRREYFQSTEMSGQTETAVVMETEKSNPKDELNRRKEAKRRKEEERRLQAAKREEEQRKAEEARKEDERRKLEERREAAARRREEERIRLEEEREALEARRNELKKKAAEKQSENERKQKLEEEKEEIFNSLEDELKSLKTQTDMSKLIQGVDEIAAEKERAVLSRDGGSQQNKGNPGTEKQKIPVKPAKSQKLEEQEEKLIEDVLKEFFA